MTTLPSCHLSCLILVILLVPLYISCFPFSRKRLRSHLMTQLPRVHLFKKQQRKKTKQKCIHPLHLVHTHSMLLLMVCCNTYMSVHEWGEVPLHTYMCMVKGVTCKHTGWREVSPAHCTHARAVTSAIWVGETFHLQTNGSDEKCHLQQTGVRCVTCKHTGW